MILQLLKSKYFIFPILFIIWSIGIYSLAYYKGKNSELVINQINNLKTANADLVTTLNIEKDLINDSNIKSEQLEESLAISQRKYIDATKEIAHQKNNINNDNVIRNDFVRIIQQYERKSSMPTDAASTSESSTSNSRIPADRVLSYTVDLRNWGDNCRLKYNTLFNLYNSQKEIINKN